MEFNLEKYLSGILLLICLCEFIGVGYLIVSAPPPPPQITSFSSEADLKDQARAIVKNYFEPYPYFTRNFFVIFDAAQQSCIDIYASNNKKTMRAVEEYNYFSRELVAIFPLTGYLLLLTLFLGMAACVSKFSACFPLGAPLALVGAAFLVSPAISEILINVGDIFFFYWSFPSLLIGTFFIYRYWLEWFLDNNREIRNNTRLSEVLKGTFMVIFGGLVAVISIAATYTSGAHMIVIGAPAAFCLYGLYRILFALFSKENSTNVWRSVASINQQPNITFDYDFDSDLYMLSKDGDAKNWKVILHCPNDEQHVLSLEKFSAYPGCDEHIGEAAWLVEGYRPQKIEIQRPGSKPVFIIHPDTKL